MKETSRRGFLKLVGAGSVAVAAGAIVPAAAMWAGRTGADSLAFRAVGGLPQAQIPSFASYVLEGHVNLTTQSGVVTKTVYAGAPEAMSRIALPGVSRIFRVTEVRDSSGLIHISGILDDRAQLKAGENPNIDIQIDRSSRVVRAPFVGNEIALRLD